MLTTRTMIEEGRILRPSRGRPMLWRSAQEKELGLCLFGNSRRFAFCSYGSGGFKVYDLATKRWLCRSTVVRICDEFLQVCALLRSRETQKEARDGLVKLGLPPERFEKR